MDIMATIKSNTQRETPSPISMIIHRLSLIEQDSYNYPLIQGKEKHNSHQITKLRRLSVQIVK